MNVTEVRDSDFKNAFPGIFNFTVWILIRMQVKNHVMIFFQVMLCLVLPFIENPFASDGLFNVPYSSETFGLVTLSTVAAFSGAVFA